MFFVVEWCNPISYTIGLSHH